ncbi:hypothetical protein P154DRAFT_173472 [Amniculicola lignicola CBS 123094]|uniref:Uncharacterized protein n=1 Tax=Amniculicola lignicola CBS 123094 TaxID=1392246 RepID=A0A6A5WH92_9PLEO|nr:hypothetical protein P154DRAFT_173472 [Amniculicola lignicola CBS 123094]
MHMLVWARLKPPLPAFLLQLVLDISVLYTAYDTLVHTSALRYCVSTKWTGGHQNLHPLPSEMRLFRHLPLSIQGSRNRLSCNN